MEAILYSVLLVICTALCISNNLYIKMIPIAFFMGLLGQVVFGKKIMTSFFSFIIAIVLTQVRTPSNILNNLLISAIVFGISILGEILGFEVKKLNILFKTKGNKKKNKEKIKYMVLCIILCILGFSVNSIFNGNYISYFNSKNKLNNYFIKMYSSSSRFNITSAKYSISPKPRYIFYVQDILNNNNSGKFSVYLGKNNTIQDNYMQELKDKEANNISNELNTIGKISDASISVSYDESNMLVLNITKTVEKIGHEEIEQYSKDIVNFLELAKEVKNFNNVYQMNIVLMSKSNSKDNVASYIYLNSYNDMLEKNEQLPYEYIMNALNIEYFD